MRRQSAVRSAGAPLGEARSGRSVTPPAAPSTCRPKSAQGGLLPILRGSRGTRARGPKLESPGPCGSVVGGGAVLAAERNEVAERVVGGEEPLRLAGGLEPLHRPFAP